MEDNIPQKVAKYIDEGSYFSIRMDGNTHVGNLRIKRNDMVVLEYIQRAYGGYLGRDKNGGCWLNYYGDKCVRVVQEILPHLVVKNQHALCLLQFFALVKQNKVGKRPGTKLPDWQKEKREELRLMMEELNR